MTPSQSTASGNPRNTAVHRPHYYDQGSNDFPYHSSVLNDIPNHRQETLGPSLRLLLLFLSSGFIFPASRFFVYRNDTTCAYTLPTSNLNDSWIETSHPPVAIAWNMAVRVISEDCSRVVCHRSGEAVGYISPSSWSIIQAEKP